LIEFPINETLEQQGSHRHQFSWPCCQPFGVAHQIGSHYGLAQSTRPTAIQGFRIKQEREHVLPLNHISVVAVVGAVSLAKVPIVIIIIIAVPPATALSVVFKSLVLGIEAWGISHLNVIITITLLTCMVILPATAMPSAVVIEPTPSSLSHTLRVSVHGRLS